MLVLTVAFLGLDSGTEKAFDEVDAIVEDEPLLAVVDDRTFTGATLLGLSMFATSSWARCSRCS